MNLTITFQDANGKTIDEVETTNENQFEVPDGTVTIMVTEN